MDFLSFCATTLQTKKLSCTQYSFVCTDDNSHFSYLQMLRTVFAKSDLPSFTIISLQSNTFDVVNSMFSMTFLGEKRIYFLCDLQLLSPAGQKKYIDCLRLINSEHIIFLVTQNDISYGTPITTKTILTRHEAIVLASLIASKEQSYFFPFFDALENQGIKIFPKDLNFLLLYSGVVGDKSPEFFTTWIPRIFSSEKSLFQLSDAFFAKELTVFLNFWHTLSEQYSIAFWSLFFSEQIFKAVLYIKACKTKKKIEPEIKHRLPFRFLNKSWQLHDISALINLHQEICNFDIAFKNGEVRQEQLELLCLQYIIQ